MKMRLHFEKNILILTSRQNNVWTSMQEIVPLIEKQWTGFDSDLSSSIINCDNSNLAKIAKSAINSDLIIFTVFNLAISRAACFIREHLGVDSPWVIYLHGQATIGMWPYANWKMSNFFKVSDLFIGTCQGDHDALKLIYPEAHFYKSTFSYSPLDEGEILDISHDKHSFIYIGRLSSQKQLHQLLWAFSIFKKNNTNNIDLHFFGSEDELGSPNHGIPGGGYLLFLKNIAKLLGIQKFVTFHGFLKREDIHASLKGWSHTLIFPSLHSDENFGMSLMRGLCEGSTAICTEWGGFIEHLNEFPSSVKSIPVRAGSLGPFIFVDDLVRAMQDYNQLVPEENIPIRYNNNETVRIKDHITELLSLVISQKKLHSTRTLNKILEQRDLFSKKSSQKIFSNYSDNIALKFFYSYGMKSVPLNISKTYSFAPWVNQIDNKFFVSEPHKGEQVFDDMQDLITNGFVTFL